MTTEQLRIGAEAIIYQQHHVTKNEAVAAIVQLAETYAQSQNSGKPLVSGWRDFRAQKPSSGDQVLVKDPSLVQGDRWVTEWDDESIGFYLTYELLWMPLPA